MATYLQKREILDINDSEKLAFNTAFDQEFKVSVIESSNLSYEEFFNKFMLRNIPCVLKNICSTWECSNKWVKENSIDYNYIANAYGDLIAPVANCSDIKFDAHTKSDMDLRTYCGYLSRETKNVLLYLKDWHLKKVRPNDNFYSVPKFFASDWLNEYAEDNDQDDFKFVYIGPKMSWTPLHVDVYKSYSWSVNVVGRKKWILYPPGEEEKLKNNFGKLPMTYEPENNKDLKFYEVFQNKGDGIFVPSGWYHQVVNEVDTISVNHNWINGCNISYVWKELTKHLVLVEHEVEDLKKSSEYDTICQQLLQTDYGMNFDLFIKLIIHIGLKRLSQLKCDSYVSENHFFGTNHIKFDLESILTVIDLVISHPVYSNKFKVDENLIQLKQNIKEHLAI